MGSAGQACKPEGLASVPPAPSRSHPTLKVPEDSSLREKQAATVWTGGAHVATWQCLLADKWGEGPWSERLRAGPS